MSPALKPGDIVIVDTWVYNNNQPKINDILIMRRTKKSTILAKRLTNIHVKKDKTELFIEGDNKN